MKVVVTGGAGFVGANVCRALAAVPDIAEILVIDDLSTGSAHSVTRLAGVRLVVGSVLDSGLVRRAIADATAVIHLAARTSVPLSLAEPSDTYDVNVTGTLTVLEAARLARAYVLLASSAAVYGDGGSARMNEQQALAPTNPYGASKVAAEAHLEAYRTEFGLAGLSLRMFNVYGPGQRVAEPFPALIPSLVSSALGHRPLRVHRTGEQSRDLVYVGTVSSAMVTAIQLQITHPSAINVASGQATDIHTVIGELERQLGRSLEVEYLPPRSGDVRDSSGDPTLFRRRFPEVPFVDLSTGLRKTLEWWTTA